ncbi:uncharacterized protein LOC106870183 [Octopus bimaculoides]|uniref:Zinc finger C3HC4 RING-type domain-containing protein n=1 Tax=Octopus bimaculoides TaxID=37653 RepID=A0A0L8HK55_OCTBM|nr:uncharacterized protein LOC106870183 [Octopus bimaculoides]XP_052831983.1 uncharacterized protein LOC106870183 [Octopus bimaculoides]|eukprot:XP_014771671.1 PREDICTED: uncharacterized protein LOC106870183 [Octopus bimaculoides]
MRIKMSYKNILTCNLCENRFTTPPRRFPCLHTFCERCLTHRILVRAIESIVRQKDALLARREMDLEKVSVASTATLSKRSSIDSTCSTAIISRKSSASRVNTTEDEAVETDEPAADIPHADKPSEKEEAPEKPPVRSRFAFLFSSRRAAKNLAKKAEKKKDDEKENNENNKNEEENKEKVVNNEDDGQSANKNYNPFEDSDEEGVNKEKPEEGASKENIANDVETPKTPTGARSESRRESVRSVRSERSVKSERSMKSERSLRSTSKAESLVGDSGSVHDSLALSMYDRENFMAFAVKPDYTDNDLLCVATRIWCPKCKIEIKLNVEIPVTEPIIQNSAIKEIIMNKFPINDFVEYLLKADRRSREEQKCTSCFKRNNIKIAITWCIQCGQGYCHMCTDLHKGFDPFRSHNIFDISKNKHQKLLGISSICEKHLDYFSVYCSSCRIPLCLQCSSQHYREKHASDGQQPMLLSDIANEKRREGEGILRTIASRKDNKLSVIQELQKRLNSLKSKKSSLIRDVDSTINDIVMKLQTEALVKLHLEVGQMVSVEEEKLRSEIQQTEMQIEILNQSFLCMDVALDEAHDDQMITIFHDINKTLQFKEMTEPLSSNVVTRIFLRYNNEISAFFERLKQFPNADLVQNFPDDTMPTNGLLIGEIGDASPLEPATSTETLATDNDSKSLSEADKDNSNALVPARADKDKTNVGSRLFPSGSSPLAYAFLGSVNEVSEVNKPILLFDVLFLNDDRIVVSDFHHKNIKEFNKEGHLLACCSVEGSPTGICAISEHMVVCVLPWSKCICFLMRDTRSNFLAISTKVVVENQYIGVAKMDSKRLICSRDNAVDLLSLNGEILQTLSTLREEYGRLIEPRYLAKVAVDGNFLISDCKRSALICCNIEGDVKFLYTGSVEHSLMKPSGVCVDDNGFIYLADSEANKIYRLNGNGLFDKVMYDASDGLTLPRGLDISPDGMTLYLSESDSGIVKVLRKKETVET